MIDDIFLVRSTVHFLFFMIGASPVGLSSTSTVNKYPTNIRFANIWRRNAITV